MQKICGQLCTCGCQNWEYARITWWSLPKCGSLGLVRNSDSEVWGGGPGISSFKNHLKIFSFRCSWTPPSQNRPRVGLVCGIIGNNLEAFVGIGWSRGLGAMLTILFWSLNGVWNVIYFRDIFWNVCTWNDMIFGMCLKIIQFGQDLEMERENGWECGWNRIGHVLMTVEAGWWFIMLLYLSFCISASFHNKKQIRRD